MTTIAYDGRTVAADRCCFNGAYKAEVQKVYKLADGTIFAASGSLSDLHAVKGWVEAGMPEDLRPEMKQEEVSGFLLVLPGGQAFEMEYQLVPMPVIPPIALGSGAMAAIAAMKLGRTPKQAVELAMEIDPFTGIGVDVVRVKSVEQSKPRGRKCTS